MPRTDFCRLIYSLFLPLQYENIIKFQYVAIIIQFHIKTDFPYMKIDGFKYTEIIREIFCMALC